MYSLTLSLPSLTMVFIDQMAYDQFDLLRKFRDMEQGYNKWTFTLAKYNSFTNNSMFQLLKRYLLTILTFSLIFFIKNYFLVVKLHSLYNVNKNKFANQS